MQPMMATALCGRLAASGSLSAPSGGSPSTSSGRMFDFGFLSELGADSFKRVLIGSVGGFVAFGFLLTRDVHGQVRRRCGARALPERYRRALLGDDMMIIGLPMLLVAFVTLLVSHSLFPDERDFRILGPLPVRRLVVFRAKLGALLMFTGLFTAAAHVSLLPLMLLTSLNPWGDTQRHPAAVRLGHRQRHRIGVRHPRHHRRRGSARSRTLAQPAAGAVHVHAQHRARPARGVPAACLAPPDARRPLARGAAWMVFVPPAWFLGLQRVLQGSADPWLARLALIGLAAAAFVAAIVAATYIVLFRQFERLMLRPAPTSPPWWRVDRLCQPSRAAAAFRGVFGFTIATLGRSQLHQGVLVGLSACGVGLATIFLTSAG